MVCWRTYSRASEKELQNRSHCCHQAIHLKSNLKLFPISKGEHLVFILLAATCYLNYLYCCPCFQWALSHFSDNDKARCFMLVLDNSSFTNYSLYIIFCCMVTCTSWITSILFWQHLHLFFLFMVSHSSSGYIWKVSFWLKQSSD